MDNPVRHHSEPNSQNSDFKDSERHRSGKHIQEMYENAGRSESKVTPDSLADSETGERGELLRPSERPSHVVDPHDDPAEGARE
jgi:hypothetical protein